MDEEVIPGHILNLMCAIHLRQDHGYKAWTIARFTEHFPGLCTGDGGFGFTTLHVLHHIRVGSPVLNDLGVEVAYVRVDLNDADQLKHQPQLHEGARDASGGSGATERRAMPRGSGWSPG
jgi:hypothetical protein